MLIDPVASRQIITSIASSKDDMNDGLQVGGLAYQG